MKSEVVQHLLEDTVERTYAAQIWADLGAGNGVFTHALSTMLHDGSTLYAIDTNATRMESIRIWQQVVLKKIQADFTRDSWNTEPLNGILMANSLHFVKEKEAFLKSIKGKLLLGGRLIIVEYEMEKGNSWVPYPIKFKALATLARETGFVSVQKIKEVPSVYEGRMIYSALLLR